jgi:MATE family multidrug resistance protein
MTARGPRSHTARIAALAWPLLIGQVAVIAYGVIDTAMTSRYSAMDLAALALGTSIYISVYVGLNGVLQAIAPSIGQLFGARKVEAVGFEVKQGMWLALFLTCVGALVLLFPQPLLDLAQPSPELREKAESYLAILALALPASLGFRVYSALNTALGRPKMVMAIQVAGLLLKIPLNALFIFGAWGFPAMGGPGCALATTVIAWLMMTAGWLIVRYGPAYREFHLFGTGFVRPQWKTQRALLHLGIPMGLSYLIEVTAFTFMALFIARLGATAVAGHQITANFATLLYMLPLSIASATGTLVAHAIGAREWETAHRVGNAGMLLAAGTATVLGVVVWFAREWIIRAYTPDMDIYAAALPLFVFIAFYQFFDALQITAAFVLRAYKIALVPTLIYAFALWGIGLGGGYLLGLDPFGWSPPTLQGAAGFWMGNSASIALVAIALYWYLRYVQRVFARQ